MGPLNVWNRHESTAFSGDCIGVVSRKDFLVILLNYSCCCVHLIAWLSTFWCKWGLGCHQRILGADVRRVLFRSLSYDVINLCVILRCYLNFSNTSLLCWLYIFCLFFVIFFICLALGNLLDLTYIHGS